jgi:hypothetical protein
MRHTPLLTIAMLLSLFLGTLLTLVRPVAAVPCDAGRRHDAAASEILKTQRPFAPANRDLFTNYRRADWADVPPLRDVEGPALTDQETNDALRTFLERRFPCSPRRVSDGLAVYSNPVARLKIPDPTLRAALAALTGTLGEPAIQFLLNQAPVGSIHFGVVIGFGDGLPPRTTAQTYRLADETWQIVFDGRLRFSPFGSFSALLFHELLHVQSPPAVSNAGDKLDGIGLPEEATAVALESLIYMQMLLTDPTLARLPDLLTRGGSNHMVLIRLNSGIAGTDRLNLFLPGSDVNLDPIATTPITEFYEYYAKWVQTGSVTPEWRNLETHGNSLLAAVLPALADSGHSPPARPDFDRATLDFIDQNEGVLSTGQLIAVACILELDVPCD